MKTSKTFKGITFVALLSTVLAIPVFAQGGAGMGNGMSNGHGYGAGCPMMGMGGMGYGHNGMGKGMGRGMHHGGMTGNQNFAHGWELFTPEEMTQFQIKMREVKTYDECKVAYTEHRNTLETRAKEKGVTVMQPRFSPCDSLQAQGLIK